MIVSVAAASLSFAPADLLLEPCFAFHVLFHVRVILCHSRRYREIDLASYSFLGQEHVSPDPEIGVNKDNCHWNIFRFSHTCGKYIWLAEVPQNRAKNPSPIGGHTLVKPLQGSSSVVLPCPVKFNHVRVQFL